MNIFPNPASNTHFIMINFDAPLSGTLSIIIYDLHGEKLYTEWIRDVINITTYKLSLCQIQRGTYIVQASSDGKTGIQKLILE